MSSNNDLRAGSGPVNSQIGAADAYYNGVLKQQALFNGLFDKFASYVKEKRNEKREDVINQQKDALHNLQVGQLTKQNELLNKNLKYFDTDKKEEQKRNKALNAATYASVNLTNQQNKALKMQNDEKNDFINLSKRLKPLSNDTSGFNDNTLNDSDIEKALMFNENSLLPNRN